MSPKAYIFERPFFRGVFLEGRAYLRRENCRGDLTWRYWFFFGGRGGGGGGGLYLEGQFNRRFLALLVLGGLILGGAYFRNFTVA